MHRLDIDTNRLRFFPFNSLTVPPRQAGFWVCHRRRHSITGGIMVERSPPSFQKSLIWNENEPPTSMRWLIDDGDFYGWLWLLHQSGTGDTVGFFFFRFRFTKMICRKFGPKLSVLAVIMAKNRALSALAVNVGLSIRIGDMEYSLWQMSSSRESVIDLFLLGNLVEDNNYLNLSTISSISNNS